MKEGIQKIPSGVRAPNSGYKAPNALTVDQLGLQVPEIPLRSNDLLNRDERGKHYTKY